MSFGWVGGNTKEGSLQSAVFEQGNVPASRCFYISARISPTLVEGDNMSINFAALGSYGSRVAFVYMVYARGGNEIFRYARNASPGLT